MRGFIASVLGIKNLKTYLVLFLGLSTMFFYTKAAREKESRQMQESNALNARRWALDSVQMMQQYLSAKELSAYLEQTNTQLQAKIQADGIKARQVQQIVHQKKVLIDSSFYKKDLSESLPDILKGVSFKMPFEKKSPCLLTKGYVYFEKDSLALVIDHQKYEGLSDYVSYTKRLKHRWFFGIKTNLFGKKVISVKVYDECGNSRLLVLDRKK